MSRYIDAEKLIDDIRPFAEYDSNRRNKDWVRRFEIAIDDQPTADVRKNVRGEWISHDLENGEKSIDKDCCSVCGERFREITMTGCEWNFCPNCGAEMRREDNGRDEENHNRV